MLQTTHRKYSWPAEQLRQIKDGGLLLLAFIFLTARATDSTNGLSNHDHSGCGPIPTSQPDSPPPPMHKSNSQLNKPSISKQCNQRHCICGSSNLDATRSGHDPYVEIEGFRFEYKPKARHSTIINEDAINLLLPKYHMSSVKVC